MEQVLDADAISLRWPAWPLTGTPVLLVGLLALIGDDRHWPRIGVINLHLLFGAVLLLAVSLTLSRQWREARSVGAAQYYLSARLLARRVYALMYVMAAVRLGLYGLDANGRSITDFQVYLIYGFAAVALIRLCAVFLPRARP